MPGVDVRALEAFLAPVVGPVEGLRVSLLSGGRSNLTYELRADPTHGPAAGERRWVLRRPPLGMIPETAHDMAREAAVMAALAPTPVPVPAVIARCDELGVLGAPFYVMEKVEGTVFRSDADLAALTPDAATSLAHGFVDTMAALHLVDPGRVGLDGFGRADGYLARQVRRWGRQLEATCEREIPGFAELAAKLGADIPAQPRAAVVHGDYRLDNVIVDPHAPHGVRAVLDWEMATLGDPLADLGLFHLYWIGWHGIDNPIAGTPGALPGFPAWETLAERYATRTGLNLERFAWYAAFACFKLAVICEGIHTRHTRGLTVGDGFASIGDMVPQLVDRGLTTLHA
ncbi:MAG: phosphotransferase family protein [Streptomycetaceae bacterium]|nr:phosphotransferase family protein [Streptomycetaceae bacterium]